jgi:archaemetzincin
MKPDCHRIGVIPFGNIPDIVPNVIAAHISGYLNLEAVLLETKAEPNYALDRQRLQFNVGTILHHLESNFSAPAPKIIGVLNVDLFVPVFAHVYGQARQGGRAAIISLYRLREENGGPAEPSALVLERAAKIALHEICHLYNLIHCQDCHCLMHFSGSLADLDQLPMGFCRYCSQYIREATQFDFTDKPL